MCTHQQQTVSNGQIVIIVNKSIYALASLCIDVNRSGQSLNEKEVDLSVHWCTFTDAVSPRFNQGTHIIWFQVFNYQYMCMVWCLHDEDYVSTN